MRGSALVLTPAFEGWRDLRYWPWWWRNSVSSEAKTASAVLLAAATFLVGFLVAARLTDTPEAASFTTERVFTILDRNGAPKNITETVTEPGMTKAVPVQRNGHTVVVRGTGETRTVRGPVRNSVVTDRRTDTVVRTETADHSTTVTTPGGTATVTTEVTQPQRTVTETTTDRVTVTDQVTVTTTLTDTVTVTVTPRPSGFRASVRGAARPFPD